MTTIAIKIELSNLDKAMTEVKALEAYILELAKTYPTTFATETPVEEPKVAKKAVKAVKPKPTPKKETKVVEEPVKQEEDVVADAVTSSLTLAELTKLAKEAVVKSDRGTVKAIIVKHGAQKLSGIDEAKFEALKADFDALVA